MIDPQHHPLLPPTMAGGGFSPFASGSPQQHNPPLSATSLTQHFSLSSPGGVGGGAGSSSNGGGGMMMMGFSSPDQTSANASPAMIQPAIAAAELLGKATSSGSGSGSRHDLMPGGSALQNHHLQFYPQQQQQQQPVSAALGSPWRSGSTEDAFAAAVAAAGFTPPPPPPPPPYQQHHQQHHSNTASPMSRSSTASAQQLLLQHQHQQLQQQAALSRSLSVDVGMMSQQAQAAGGLLGGPQGGSGRWGSSRLSYDAAGMGGGGGGGGGGGHHQHHQHHHHDPHQGRFGSVYDMKSLTAALAHVQAGTGDVRRMLSACTFRPRLPGLTKLVSQMSREGHWAKALEVYESLDAVGVRPDTTITNAAISACDKGGQWEKALQVFKSMSDLGMERDAITYSALISALSKGRQWGLAIDVFNHMVAEGVECDAVTCCSLITALDKGGQWQLAEQVFIQMYRHHPQFHVLLEGMDTETGDADGAAGGGAAGPNGSPEIGRASSLLAGTFTTAALNALSISEDVLPPPEQLLAMMEAPGADVRQESGSPDQGDKSGAGASARPASAGAAEQGSTANGHAATASSAGSAAASVSGTTISRSYEHSSLSEHQDSTAEGPVRTLSGAWSKVMLSKAMAEAGAACIDITNNSTTQQDMPCTWPPTSSSTTAASTTTAATSPGTPPLGHHHASAMHACELANASQCNSSNNLSLMPAFGIARQGRGETKPADSSKDAAANQQDSTQDVSSNAAAAAAPDAHAGTTPTGPTAFKPGTSAFAAAGTAPLDADAASAGGGPPDQQQQQHKGGLASPHRPPLHPSKHTASAVGPGQGAASASSSSSLPASASQGSLAGQMLQQGLSPAGSLGHSGGPATSPGSTASPARSGSAGTMMRLGLTRSLNSKKSSPNRVCCNALLAAYARATPPRWQQALKLLEVMWQCGGELVPDIVSYNTVMKACGNAQQTDKAFELYQHMQQRGIEPTVATFGTLITIASESQAYDRVKESWGWLQASGLPVHITCVNSYLTALIKEDNWDAAVDLFQQLKSSQLGVRPNSVTYNILMSACLTRGRPQNVKALFDEMTAANLSPTLISFNTLLHAYAKMGAWQDSLAVLQHMCTSSPVRPSTSSFNTVFCTLSSVAASVSEVDKQVLAARALEVYGMMAQLPGLHPDSALYRTIISTFNACSAPKTVLQVALIMAQEGHSMDAPSASAALEALQQEGAWHLSGPLLYSCLDAGAVVSPLLLQHILLVCTQDKAWRVAKEVLQVTCAANQLDAVAQLLQQTRTQLQSAADGGQQQHLGMQVVPGLLPEPEALDELLFLTYLQAQYSSGGWVEGVSLFKQLQQNRGTSFAVCNGVLLGSLLELLVVRGGPQGTLEAIGIVDDCHAKGFMAHYIPAAAATGSSSATAGVVGGSPIRSPSTASPAAAAASALLSPEQQLILQLESAGLSLGGANPPGLPAGSSSSGMGTFSLFPNVTAAGSQLGAAQSAGQAFDLSAVLDFGPQTAAAGGGIYGGAAGAAFGGLSLSVTALSTLDVRGCSAVEALVLTLSWLGQLVLHVASGQPLPGLRLQVHTGSSGLVNFSAPTLDIKLYRAVTGRGRSTSSTAAVDGDTASIGAGLGSTGDGSGLLQPGLPSDAAAAAAGACVTSAAAPAGSEEDRISASGTTPAAAAFLSMDRSTSLQPPAAATGTSPAAATGAPSSASAIASQSDILQVPGVNLSVHSVVLAVFSGLLGTMLGCADDMGLLIPFSVAGKLPLGLLCLSALPAQLPDELQGGGVALDAAAMSQAIASAISVAQGEGSTGAAT